MVAEARSEREAAYGRFVGAPSRAELERSFFLDDADKRLVAKRRGDRNRAGLALQLGTVRFLGMFLADPTDVPAEVVAYVAEQVGAAGPSCLDGYLDRRATRFEHTAEIVAAYGYRDFATAEKELVQWLDDRAWTTGEGPTALFAGAVRWMRERQVLLPGLTTLRRLVGGVREAAMQRLWDVLAALVTREQARKLERLLIVPDGSRVSDLERLRTGPTTVSGKSMVAALERVAELAALGFGSLDLPVPQRRVVELARWGMAGKAPALRRHPRARRRATLLATVVYLEAKAIDDALELFDVLMVNDLMAKAQRQSAAEKARRYPRVSRDAARLAAAVAVLFDSSDDQAVTLAEIWGAIDDVVPRGELRAALESIAALAPAPDIDPGGAWRAVLVERYAVVQKFLALMCRTVSFGASAEAAGVLAALLDLPGLLDARATRRVPAGFLDERLVALDVVPAGWWRQLVLAPERPAGTVDRAAYVFCVLEQFHQRLRGRDIFATASSRWTDPGARLLSGPAWQAARGPVLNALDLPADPEELLADHARDLDDAWRHAARELDSAERGVSIDADGRLHVASLDAIPDPASLTALRPQLEGMLPRVDIGELILEVISWHPGFVAAFTAASGGENRLADLNVTIAAALTAHALNIGYTPVLSPGVPALTRARISHVDQNYLRTDTYAGANVPLIEAQADIALAQALGGGLVAGVDGIRFVVPVASIHARPNPKYFGRRRGATWLNLLSDQAVGLASRVVSGTPRDSLHIIDLIYRQDGGRRPEVIVSDSGSYSDIVFGLLQLLGFDYRPQFADLPDSKLWLIDPSADYGPLNPAARGKIDLDRIRRHWPDILRLVASIHTGAVSAHDVIRMLSSAGKTTQLGEALAHYGRIFKTLHVLVYVDDETYRRQIKAIRNLQEGRHDLARHVFHGGKGELRRHYQEGMEDQLGALGLVLNCITLWNTVYLDAALTRLRADGHPASDEDIARLSPYVRRHINVQGRHSFQLPELAGARRALRDPNAADDDHD